jgi:hypothetical protein
MQPLSNHEHIEDIGAVAQCPDGSPSAAFADSAPEPLFQTNTPVLVRNSFDGRFCQGFTVIDASPLGYRLRRHSDGAVLPVVFPHRDVIPDRNSLPLR